MGIFKSIGHGVLATLRRPRLVAVLWVVNIAYAAVAAFPLLAIVQAELGHSLLGSYVRPFDLMWVGEAVLKYRDALPALAGGILASAAAFLVLSVFLNGGIVGRLVDREGSSSVRAFFADCGLYFGRFARLFLASILFTVLTFGVVLRLLSALTDLGLENAATEWPLVILKNLHLLAALLLLSIVHMIFDYARIAVVADGEAKALRALRHAVKFLMKRFFRAWALYALITAGLIAGTAVFHAGLGRLAGPGVPAIVLGLVWMQLHIVFRIWIKVLYFAAQAEFYRSHPY